MTSPAIAILFHQRHVVPTCALNRMLRLLHLILLFRVLILRVVHVRSRRCAYLWSFRYKTRKGFSRTSIFCCETHGFGNASSALSARPSQLSMCFIHWSTAPGTHSITVEVLFSITSCLCALLRPPSSVWVWRWLLRSLDLLFPTLSVLALPGVRIRSNQFTTGFFWSWFSPFCFCWHLCPHASTLASYPSTLTSFTGWLEVRRVLCWGGVTGLCPT